MYDEKKEMQVIPKQTNQTPFWSFQKQMNNVNETYILAIKTKNLCQKLSKLMICWLMSSYKWVTLPLQLMAVSQQ